MEDQFPYTSSEEERAARRAQRAEARQKRLRERRRRRLRQLFLPALLLGLTLTFLLSAWAGHQRAQPDPEAEPAMTEAAPPAADPPAEQTPAWAVSATAGTVRLDDAIDSAYAVVIDLETGDILAEKDADAVIPPASMTKILTALVAAEQIDDLDAPFTITREITDYCFLHKCSVVGFELDETVTVRDLLYGTILSSGADAALGLAIHVAGSQEAFVALMNAKLEELGLSSTARFTNCVGVYEEGHACTVTDMALILKAAMENALCRQVLSAHTFETPPTPQHPEGQVLSNWFLRRIEDHVPEGFQVVGAKTGYVAQSGSCAASYGQNAAGRACLCVTAKAASSWRCIFDHVALYSEYCA